MSRHIVIRPWIGCLERQSAVQGTLASRHLKDGHLVLYDITSSYFEGAYAQSEIVTSGYNRDGKGGHEQMVIALLCSAEGCEAPPIWLTRKLKVK